MEDGSHAIYLSTYGENREEVPEELIAFLDFVRSPLEESEREVADTYIRQLQDSVRRVKADREIKKPSFFENRRSVLFEKPSFFENRRPVLFEKPESVVGAM